MDLTSAFPLHLTGTMETYSFEQYGDGINTPDGVSYTSGGLDLREEHIPGPYTTSLAKYFNANGTDSWIAESERGLGYRQSGHLRPVTPVNAHDNGLVRYEANHRDRGHSNTDDPADIAVNNGNSSRSTFGPQRDHDGQGTAGVARPQTRFLPRRPSTASAHRANPSHWGRNRHQAYDRCASLDGTPEMDGSKRWATDQSISPGPPGPARTAARIMNQRTTLAPSINDLSEWQSQETETTASIEVNSYTPETEPRQLILQRSAIESVDPSPRRKKARLKTSSNEYELRGGRSPMLQSTQQLSPEMDLSMVSPPTSLSPPLSLDCSFPDCGRKFSGESRVGNRKRHLKSYHQILDGQTLLSLKCSAPRCKRLFKRSDARLKHERKKHAELDRSPPRLRGST
jgi:uncharacterized C2H2 Zn-finger protein